MTATSPPSRRAMLRPLTVAMALVVVALAAPFGPPRTLASVPVTAGFRDHQYGDPAAPGGDDVTAGRNQSKLWFHDGKWWGLLFDARTTTNAKFRIWKFSMATQSWINTGVAVDDRNRSHADVLTSANTLYVASARAENATPTTGRDLRIYRYAYNATTDTYALAAGFPKVIPSTASGTGYSTIAQDAFGVLWVAFTQANRVRISRSSDAGQTWSAPIDVPGQGNNITANDVVAIARLSIPGTSAVGVLWSNQSATDDAFYFAAHLDGAAVGAWQARETAFGTASAYDADGHISLKTDASGNLIAAIKTGRDEDPAPNGGDPLIAVIKRTGSPAAAGGWTSHTVTTVTLEGTRPILVLDAQASRANVFFTYPTLLADGDQAIRRRSAPLATLDFGAPSLGTPFIASSTEVGINDATSMKQVATATTGMVVLAANIPTLTYLHGCAGGPCPAPAVAPVANFTATPLSGAAPLTVNFTDTSTNTPTAWSWTFGDGGTSTVKNPSHTYSDAGTYSVTLTATNSAGSDGETKSGYITVGAPVEATYDPIDPVRLLDTRFGTGGLTGKFQAKVPRTFNVAGAAGSGIPANAVAVTGNLTVVSQTAAGYVALGPVADSTPSFSTLNFPLGDTRGNGVTVPLNGSGDLSAVYIAPTGKSTHLVLDITGYFVNGTAEATFDTPADPLRILDSRNGTGGLSGPFQATVPRTFDVGGVADIPAGAVAVTGNLTVVGQTQAGYVALGPVADSTPSYSTLNFPLGDTRGNGVTVQLGTNGNLSAVYMAQPGKTAHLVFDVTGFFIAGTSGASFVPVDPARIVDTRIALGVSSALVHATPRTWSAAGHDGVGSDAVAIVGNATVVGQTKAGYVVLTPTPEVAPTLSTLNFPLGDVRGNAFTVGVTSENVSSVYRASAGATTHFIVDVTGYYR